MIETAATHKKLASLQSTRPKNPSRLALSKSSYQGSKHIYRHPLLNRPIHRTKPRARWSCSNVFVSFRSSSQEHRIPSFFSSGIHPPSPHHLSPPAFEWSLIVLEALLIVSAATDLGPEHGLTMRRNLGHSTLHTQSDVARRILTLVTTLFVR